MLESEGLGLMEVLIEEITYTSLDVNGDGLVDVNDVTYSIANIYNGTLTIWELQAIINEAVANLGG